MEPDKYLSFHFYDIIIEPENVVAAIIQACRRSQAMRIQALCQIDDDFLVVLTACEFSAVPDELFWLDISEQQFRDLVPLLQERWQSGFSAIGVVTDQEQPRRSFMLLQRTVSKKA